MILEDESHKRFSHIQQSGTEGADWVEAVGTMWERDSGPVSVRICS